MRISLFIVMLLGSLNAAAELASEDAGATFVGAARAYDSGQYARAVDMLEAVLAVEPDCARCAHLLGKSYGSLAEQAAWSEAIGLAKKTRVALEQAVALAPDDQDAVRDLIKYYRAAPGFLGGSSKKAEQLEQRLRRFAADRTS